MGQFLMSNIVCVVGPGEEIGCWLQLGLVSRFAHLTWWIETNGFIDIS